MFELYWHLGRHQLKLGTHLYCKCVIFVFVFIFVLVTVFVLDLILWILVWIVLTLGRHQLKLGTHLNLFNYHHKYFNGSRLKSRFQIHTNTALNLQRGKWTQNFSIQQSKNSSSSWLSGHMYSYHVKLYCSRHRMQALLRTYREGEVSLWPF